MHCFLEIRRVFDATLRFLGVQGVLFKTSQYTPGLRIRQPVRFVYFCVNSPVRSSIPWRPLKQTMAWKVKCRSHSEEEQSTSRSDTAAGACGTAGRAVTYSAALWSPVSPHQDGQWLLALNAVDMCHLLQNPGLSRSSRFPKSAVSMYIRIHCVSPAETRRMREPSLSRRFGNGETRLNSVISFRIRGLI